MNYQALVKISYETIVEIEADGIIEAANLVIPEIKKNLITGDDTDISDIRIVSIYEADLSNVVSIINRKNITANGTVLTDEKINELADEAERGYDPSKLTPKRRGRPPGSKNRPREGMVPDALGMVSESEQSEAEPIDPNDQQPGDEDISQIAPETREFIEFADKQEQAYYGEPSENSEVQFVPGAPLPPPPPLPPLFTENR
jgi:hypothetical protein